MHGLAASPAARCVGKVRAEAARPLDPSRSTAVRLSARVVYGATIVPSSRIPFPQARGGAGIRGCSARRGPVGANAAFAACGASEGETRIVHSVAHLSTAQQLGLFAFWAVIGAAVFLHADRHGSRHPTAWGFSVFIGNAIMLVVYAIHVYLIRRRRRL